MSVFKTALVLSVAIAILPSDRAQQERLYTTVSNAALWSSTYCERNAGQCEMAHAAWQVFLAKAQFAGEVVYDIAARHAFGNGGISAPGTEIAPRAIERIRLDEPRAAPIKASGTLTTSDLEPRWRG